MSNPLSSLKKPHKNPFGQRSMPFRNPQYSNDEEKLLEEITGGMASERIRTRDPYLGGLPKPPEPSVSRSQGFGMTPRSSGSLPTISSKKDLPRSDTDLDLDPSDEGHPPGDHELMSTMISRITQLEARLAYQSKELSDKDKKIRVLIDKVQLLQKSQEADRPSHAAELENKCYLLQQQVYDMETFLADYGMVWVGQKSGDDSDTYNDSDEEELWRQASSVSQNPTFKVDYNLIIENIKDLNALAGDGVATVNHTKGGARLKMPESIQLTLYANGIFMFNGPFRSFSEPMTQRCIKDIMDGYFPSELQARYPDGVPFSVTDKREVHFEDKRAEVFQGEGQTLGGDTKPSRLVPSNLQDKSIGTTEAGGDEAKETTSKHPGTQLTVEQFLKKLPKSVVKAGKVIDIRNTVGETFQGGPRSQGDITLVETDAVNEMKKRLENQERPYTPRDIATLRIKSEDGNHTYILKMRFHDTIGDIRKYITLQRSAGAPAFDIVSAYPNKVHSDDSMTLLDAGMTPNAVAHLKARRS